MDSKFLIRKIDFSQPTGELFAHFVQLATMEALAIADDECLILLRNLYQPIRYHRSPDTQKQLSFAIAFFNSLTEEQKDALRDTRNYSRATKLAAEAVIDYLVPELLEMYPANTAEPNIFKLRALVNFFEMLNSLMLFYIYNGEDNMSTDVLHEVLENYKQAIRNYEEHEGETV